MSDSYTHRLEHCIFILGYLNKFVQKLSKQKQYHNNIFCTQHNFELGS